MDSKNGSGHSVAQTRAHFALIAEELARRASFDYVKDRAKTAATQRAKNAANEVRIHPILASAIAAGIGAAALFTVLKRLRSPKTPTQRATERAVKMARRMPVIAQHRANKAFDVAKASSAEAWRAFNKARERKMWIDQIVAPLVGLAVIVGAIGITASRRRAFLGAGSALDTRTLETEVQRAYE